MARYKPVDTQPKLIPIDLAQQLLPGTFEHALHHLLSGAIDLSGFDARFQNDETGAPAYAPAVLLKIVLFAYSRGIVSSRAIERACQEHVLFIALSGDSAPHFTTIARFVSTLGDEIAKVFAAVVAICDAQGLITREMFAIDGVKLPSHAAKQKSGTRAEFERQATKLEAAARTMLTAHRASDATLVGGDATADAGSTAASPTAEARIARLEQDAAKLRTWLAAHPDDRRGPKGTVRKSNRTDNDSAKMATGSGVIQGYTGVAAVDAGYQIIVDAQAHGTGSEHEVLLPVVDAIRPLLHAHSLITADAGYHSEANLRALEAWAVDALIADNDLRKRDARFATQAAHKTPPEPLHDKRRLPVVETGIFPASEFTYDAEARTCRCPAGHALVRNGHHHVIRDDIWEQFIGTERVCGACPLRAQCITDPARTRVRSVMFHRGKTAPLPPSLTAQMKARIDTPAGRARYGRRLATVEPVFANVRYNKRLDRFTLRGRAKVDGQWKLFCLVHNIEKLAHHGYAA